MDLEKSSRYIFLSVIRQFRGTLTAGSSCRLSLHADHKAGHVGEATKLRPYARPGYYWLGKRLWRADLIQGVKFL